MNELAGATRRTVGLRTGGRSERVVAAVLEAAIAELARTGYAGLRLEDVAERAGVAKTTLYRRWPTKSALIHDALRSQGIAEEIPDTGSVRGDVLLMLERIQKKIGTPQGLALARVITVEGADKENVELETLCRHLRDEVRARRVHVIERAKERGLLPPDIDGNLVLDTLYSVVVSKLLRYGERTDRATCERLVDLVITGAEHGGGTRKPRRAK
jgi:AcrR family transcriptional regulator